MNSFCCVKVVNIRRKSIYFNFPGKYNVICNYLPIIADPISIKALDLFKMLKIMEKGDVL